MMDGPHGGAYRIKVTIRFKVRRSETFVENPKACPWAEGISLSLKSLTLYVLILTRFSLFS